MRALKERGQASSVCWGRKDRFIFGLRLVRFLKAEGIKVFEVVRPKRRDQYRCG